MAHISFAANTKAAQIQFGTDGNIPIGSGSYYELYNPGYSTIAFRIEPPSTHCVQYQGSFDGHSFSDVSFREVGSDGYTQKAHNGPENVIGSVVGTRFIRFVNISGSAEPGTVEGTLNNASAILEGIEHGPPPHKFGHPLFHRGFVSSGVTFANSGLYSPPPDRRFVVSYFSMSVSSTVGTNITLHEGSGTATIPDNWVFATYVKASTNDTQTVNANLNTPFVATTLGAPLCLTSDGEANIRGVIHGYYTES